MATVLLIDDNQPMRRLVAEWLKAAGHDVIEAEDGAAGMQLVDGHSFDLVITDIIMPGRMEGMETISTLREKLPELPIIAMSAGGLAASDGYLESAMALGASATIAKPFSAEDLMEPVEELLLA